VPPCLVAPIDEPDCVTYFSSDFLSEVSILELKLHLFSKSKLVSLMSTLIDDFQELTSDRDELFNSLASLKLYLIDLKACKDIVDQENCTIEKQVAELDSSNNDLKFEILKLTLTENGKKAMSKEQESVELELEEYKQECSNAADMIKKLSQGVSKLKLDLERANRWTNSSRIVHKLSERNHNEETSLGFHKGFDDPKDLCYICGNLGHPTTECPMAAKSRSNNQNLANRFSQTKKK